MATRKRIRTNRTMAQLLMQGRERSLVKIDVMTPESIVTEALHYDDFGPYAEGHRARDYDDVHDIDYGPWDYGVGDAWFPEDDNGDFWFL